MPGRCSMKWMNGICSHGIHWWPGMLVLGMSGWHGRCLMICLREMLFLGALLLQAMYRYIYKCAFLLSFCGWLCYEILVLVFNVPTSHLFMMCVYLKRNYATGVFCWRKFLQGIWWIGWMQILYLLCMRLENKVLFVYILLNGGFGIQVFDGS